MAKIKIDQGLYERVERAAEKAGYPSVEEFLVHMIEKELSVDRNTRDLLVQVEQALVRLQQARTSYEASRDSRILQEKLLEAEERAFSLGNSNNFQIVQVQQNLATARINEITAMTAHIKAQAELNFATGQTLEKNNVSIEEAYTGRVSKNPDPPPPNG